MLKSPARLQLQENTTFHAVFEAMMKIKNVCDVVVLPPWPLCSYLPRVYHTPSFMCTQYKSKRTSSGQLVSFNCHLPAWTRRGWPTSSVAVSPLNMKIRLYSKKFTRNQLRQISSHASTTNSSKCWGKNLHTVSEPLTPSFNPDTTAG